MIPVWECEAQSHCVVEHHQGYLYLFTDAAKDGQSVDHHYLLRSPVNCTLNGRKWEVSLYCIGTFTKFTSKCPRANCHLSFHWLNNLSSEKHNIHSWWDLWLIDFSLTIQNIFSDNLEFIIEDVDFSDKHLVLIVRDGRNFRLCSISLPLPSVKVILFWFWFVLLITLPVYSNLKSFTLPV